MKARSRGHRFRRIDFDGADEMAEIFENLGEQRADHRIVLYDQDTERIHCVPSLPRVRRSSRLETRAWPPLSGGRRIRCVHAAGMVFPKRPRTKARNLLKDGVGGSTARIK